MTTLVTGGTGYIGAHIVDLLLKQGRSVVIADDVVTGIEARVPGVPILRLELSEDTAVARLRDLMMEHDVDEVVHLAARKQVGESVQRPTWYFQQNLGGLANLLAAMGEAGVTRLVFSSSAAVYGNGAGLPLLETDETRPVNPYGETKLVGEWMIRDETVARPLRAISLRYFNVAGAARPELADRAVLNLIPMVFQKMAEGQNPVIFGDTYDTADGTCVRDFIHVADLADAHLAALSRLHEQPEPFDVFNVGTGRGYSVRDVVDAVARVSGTDLHPSIESPRPGDPASVVAEVDKIGRVLGWSAIRSLSDMVSSAWSAQESSR
ncbi:UDP-glucose 4-epimerase GalE [Cryobacterium sp. TMT3-29-2]|uniref:UDP-glucose 4-epimerase GalE n=1 Tax=Cryobacterium sp. TMT3-29-2 TaxID=2555867 RepID=UPI0010735A1E|nr:UDP-glucose 4-epimerase GalE [Cryobacterium sp. TMT3-29-2]TFC86116.1 UDP-glucose 4-epimerase GalE [Cryobacterium sp. TMT3-29-2]